MPAIPQAPYNSGAQILALVQNLCGDPQGQLFDATECINDINSAARWLGLELSNRGKMTLVEDEYIVTIPPILITDPMLQVNLTFTGINGNVTAKNTPTLPDDLVEPLRLEERPTGAVVRPQNMQNWTGRGGLPRRFQNEHLRDWEWRTDMIVFVGSKNSTDVVIRYNAVPFQFTIDEDGNISGSLGDIEGIDAVAYYTAASMLPRHGSALGPTYRSEANVRLEQIATDVTRQQQFSPARMKPYGGNKVTRGSSRYM